MEKLDQVIALRASEAQLKRLKQLEDEMKAKEIKEEFDNKFKECVKDVLSPTFKKVIESFKKVNIVVRDISVTDIDNDEELHPNDICGVLIVFEKPILIYFKRTGTNKVKFIINTDLPKNEIDKTFEMDSINQEIIDTEISEFYYLHTQ